MELFENAVQTRRSNLKTPDLHFSVFGKQFENGREIFKNSGIPIIRTFPSLLRRIFFRTWHPQKRLPRRLEISLPEFSLEHNFNMAGVCCVFKLILRRIGESTEFCYSKSTFRFKKIIKHFVYLTVPTSSYPAAVVCSTIRLWWLSLLNKDWLVALFLGSEGSAVRP